MPEVTADPLNVTITNEPDKRIIRVGDWLLQSPVDKDEPLVRDVDLAKRLEYRQPRDVRKLIDRMKESGEISMIHVRATVARTSMPRGGDRKDTVKEYWLTEEQALLVSLRSDTARAVQVRQTLVRVFVAARKGLLVPAAIQAPISGAMLPATEQAIQTMAAVVVSLKKMTGKLMGDMRRLEDRMNSTALNPPAYGGVIGRESYKILAKIRGIADVIAGPGILHSDTEWKRAHKRVDQDLRGRLGFTGPWSHLPVNEEGEATRQLAMMAKEAYRRVAEGELKTAKQNQTTLFEKEKN